MRHSVIPLLSVLLLAVNTASGSLCPEPEVIAPCQCNKYFNLIDCSEVSADTNLESIFRKLAGELKKTNTRPIYDQFKLVESKLKSLESADLFSGIAFRKIAIQRNTKLAHIGSQVFSSSFAVTSEIVIEDNGSLGAQNKDAVELFKLLNQFTNLRVLHLTDSGLTQLPVGAFEQPQKELREVVLTDNRIESIGERAFVGLSHMELLNLDGNAIERLASTALQLPAPIDGKKGLLKLFMRSNRLTSSDVSFPPGIFSHLRERRVYLNLALNNLTSLPRSTFQGFFLHGHVLSVQKNPLICDCDFEWLLDQGWLYNSSSPSSNYQLRDYQCTRPILPSGGQDGDHPEFDDFEDDQEITEATRDDFRHCHTTKQSTTDGSDDQLNGGIKLREELRQKCIDANLSVEAEYSCLNGCTSMGALFSTGFSLLVMLILANH